MSKLTDALKAGIEEARLHYPYRPYDITVTGKSFIDILSTMLKEAEKEEYLTFSDGIPIDDETFIKDRLKSEVLEPLEGWYEMPIGKGIQMQKAIKALKEIIGGE